MTIVQKPTTCKPPSFNLLWAYEGAVTPRQEFQLELPLEPCKTPSSNVLWAYDNSGDRAKVTNVINNLYCYYAVPMHVTNE